MKTPVGAYTPLVPQ